MKRIISLILVIAICVGMAAMAGITFASPGDDPTLVVNENFDGATQNLVVMPNNPQPTLVVEGGGKALKLSGNDWQNANELVESATGTAQPMTDFVWQFDFMPNNSDWAFECFAFHTAGSDPYSAYRIAFMGNLTTNNNSQKGGSVVLYKGGNAAVSNGSAPISRIDLPGGLKSAWYNVKIVMQHNAQGNVITVYVNERNKPDTIQSVYYQETDPGYAPSGGFTILRGNTETFVDNMKIWNTAAGSLSDETYSTLYAPKKYTFDADAEGLADPPAMNTAHSGGKLQIGPTQNGASGVWSKDAFLGDFIAIFDYKNTLDSWADDSFKFRAAGELNDENSYAVRIMGNSNADGATISLVKRKDNANTVLAKASLSRSLIGTKDYTLKVVAKGSKFEVYFSEKALGIPATPILSVTDADSHRANGYMWFTKWDGTVTIDNITLYDLTDELLINNAATAAGPTRYWQFTDGVNPFTFTPAGGATGTTGVTPDGKLTLASRGTTAGLTAAPLGDFVAKADYIHGQTAWGENEIAFRKVDENTGYAVSVTPGNNADLTVTLKKEKYGETTQTLGTVTFPNAVSLQEISILIQAVGNKLDVWAYQKGTERPATANLYSGKDTTNPLLSGNIALGSWDSTPKFDNLFIYEGSNLNIDEEGGLPPGPIPTGILYENNFDDINPGDVVIAEGNMAESGIISEDGNTFLRMVHNGAAGGGLAKFNFGPPNVSDFTWNMNVRVNAIANPDWHSMKFRFRESSGKWTQAESFPNGSIFLQNNSSATTEIARTGPARANQDPQWPASPNPNHDPAKGIPTDGEWFKVSIVADGWKYSLYINGVLILETTDIGHITGSGGFLVEAWGVSFDVDNIKIYADPYTDIAYVPPAPPSGILYENNFDDKAPGDVVISEGNMQKSGEMAENGNTFLRMVHAGTGGDGSSLFRFGPKNVSDFTWNMNIRVNSLVNPDWHSITYRFRDKSGYWTGADVFPNGSLFEQNNGAAVNELSRTGPARENQDPRWPASPNPNHDHTKGIAADGEWHKVSIVADGWKYFLYIDGIFILEATDLAKITDNGGFCISAWGVNFDIDNILIHSEKYYNIGPDPEPEIPIGLVYKEDFEDKTMDDMSLRHGNMKKSGILYEDKNSFLRMFNDGAAGGGAITLDFGPKSVADFTMSMNVRVKSMPNMDWSYFWVGFHANPSDMDSNVSAMFTGKGSAISLTSTAKQWKLENFLVTSGKNVSGISKYPTDKPSMGIHPDGKWHNVVIVSENFNYSMHVDGRRYLSATDKSELYKKGAFFLGGWGVNLDVDDFYIWNTADQKIIKTLPYGSKGAAIPGTGDGTMTAQALIIAMAALLSVGILVTLRGRRLAKRR